MRLAGKTALITGAGSGMGRVACVLFAKEGANVIATDVDREGLFATAALVEQAKTDEESRREIALGDTRAHALHGAILPLTGDVTNPADVESWVRKGVEDFGALHVDHYNRGIFLGHRRPVLR